MMIAIFRPSGKYGKLLRGGQRQNQRKISKRRVLAVQSLLACVRLRECRPTQSMPFMAGCAKLTIVRVTSGAINGIVGCNTCT